MLYFAKPDGTHFPLTEFPSPNKSSPAAKTKCDTKTSNYLDNYLYKTYFSLNQGKTSMADFILQLGTF